MFNANTKCKQKQCDIKVGLSWNEIGPNNKNNKQTTGLQLHNKTYATVG